MFIDVLLKYMFFIILFFLIFYHYILFSPQSGITAAAPSGKPARNQRGLFLDNFVEVELPPIAVGVLYNI